MINKIITYYKKLDKTTYKILYKGLKFCLILALISASILFSYMLFFKTPFLYYIGINYIVIRSEILLLFLRKRTQAI